MFSSYQYSKMSTNNHHINSSSIHWITSQSINEKQYLSTCKNIFIGVDFGTSTTVVSQVTVNNYKVDVSPVVLSQPDEYGAMIRHHLINSVLAWKNNRLVWGQDAYRLKPHLTEGRSVFSSFKMRLGLAIGPTYPKTALSEQKNTPYTIETASDAAREFFKGLLYSLKEELSNHQLENYRFAFSVPASFEANQRRDLMKSLKENDIDERQCCFIDEPNAGFLSFIYTCIKNHLSHPLLEKLKQQECNILIYDFGAGTCDISILRVDTRNNQFTSKNLAISKFFALGGNDIDRAIARHVLFPQLLKSSPSYEPTLIEMEDLLIPQLQATAEKLKISATRWIASHKIENFQSLLDYLDTTFEDLTLENISVRKLKLTLVRPTLSIREFRAILDDFIGDFDGIHSPMHLLSPVIDALDKAQIERENVDAVLFIGGSCLNPLVRNCVMDYMNEFDDCVESILPSDLRSHVSLGAAIHCFSYHGLGLDFIKPITSEAIFIITKNNYLEQIIPASSEVPTIKPFHITLMVNQENQFLIELPICVGSKNKLLGVLNIKSDDEQPFAIGSKVEVTASITHEKLLQIEAIVNDICAKTSILNPLANKELSKNEASMLKAKQKFNQALLDYEGRPPIAIAKEYANACLNAGLYELAAELYIAIERMDKLQDFSTNICFAYERAGKHKKSNEWAEKAYKRQPNAVNAYNLSCKHYGEKKEEYLRLALQHNECYTSALLALGRILDGRGDVEGKELLKRALIILQDQVFDNNIGSKECEDLIAVCDHLKGYEQLKKTAQELKKQIQHDEYELYSSENLVDSLKPALGMKRD